MRMKFICQFDEISHHVDRALGIAIIPAVIAGMMASWRHNTLRLRWGVGICPGRGISAQRQLKREDFVRGIGMKNNPPNRKVS